VRPVRAWTLLQVAVVAAVVGWVVLGAVDRSDLGPLRVPWTAPVGLLALAGVVLAAGRPVRRWVRGARDRPLDPLRAARTLVLARATAVTGVALVGAYAAVVLLLLPTADVEPRRERLVLSLVALLAAGALAGAGVLVERWCRLPPDDDQDEGRGGAALGGR